jgi:hypothetical protein
MNTEDECKTAPNLTASNRTAGVVLVLIGGYVVFEGWHFGLGQWSRLGPGALPFGLGILMALLGASITALNPEGSETPPAIKWRPLVLILAALLAFALLVDTAGLLAATAALVILSGLADPDTTWSSLAAIYIFLVLFVYIVFVRLLSIPFSLIGG